MSLSTRLTRAGFAFLIFGSFAAMLPGNGAALAAGGGCPSGSSSHTNYTNAAYIGGGAAAATYLLGRNASGGIFPHRKKKHNGPNPYVQYPTSGAPGTATPQGTAATSGAAAAATTTAVADVSGQDKALQSYLSSAQLQ